MITNPAYGEASEYLQSLRGPTTSRSVLPAQPRQRSGLRDWRTRSGQRSLGDCSAAGLLGSTDSGTCSRHSTGRRVRRPGAGNAAVRIVHASADAPTVDIDVGNDGSAELTGVARFADSALPEYPCQQTPPLISGSSLAAT